jgi:hypothetical protein
MYSIIVSKVFGVTIVVNFLFAIVKLMYSNCKWVVVVEKMELCNLGGEGERMQFDSSSIKNDPRHKRFERLNSNFKMLKCYKECVASYCFNFKWEHTYWR